MSPLAFEQFLLDVREREIEMYEQCHEDNFNGFKHFQDSLDHKLNWINNRSKVEMNK